MKATKNNFFKNTNANWTFKKVVGYGSKEQQIFFENADFISESRSAYKYTQRGVYRMSNHFNECVATCNWLLDGEEHAYDLVIAYCPWGAFEMRGLPEAGEYASWLIA